MFEKCGHMVVCTLCRLHRMSMYVYVIIHLNETWVK